MALTFWTLKRPSLHARQECCAAPNGVQALSIDNVVAAKDLRQSPKLMSKGSSDFTMWNLLCLRHEDLGSGRTLFVADTGRRTAAGSCRATVASLID
jgi:hypothetical protein